jgi:Leucine-rich repeat (LRR) protein
MNQLFLFYSRGLRSDDDITFFHENRKDNFVKLLIAYRQLSSNQSELRISVSPVDLYRKKDLSNYTNIFVYNLSPENMFSSVRKQIGYLNNLITLDLSHMRIKFIPKEIGLLENLTTLNLNGNELTRLPHEIGNLKNLEKLDISYNSIWTLPTTFSNLKKLRDLDLESNEINNILDIISELYNLEILAIASNGYGQRLNTEINEKLPNVHLYS